MEISQLKTFAAFVRDFDKRLLHEMTSSELVERFLETNKIQVIDKNDVLYNAKLLRDPGDGPTGFALAAGFSTGCLFMQDKIFKE